MDANGWRPVLLLALGGLVVSGVALNALLRRFDVPALVGYLLLGVAYAAADRAFLHLPQQAGAVLGVLADLGIVCLLFRVGLESDLRVLWRELPRATLVLVGNVVASATAAYLVMRACGVAVVPAAFVAVAMSATSIAVAAYVWEGAGLLRSRIGALVLDVAELDDLVAVVLVVLLFAAVPALQTGAGFADAGTAAAVVTVLTRLLLFGSGCWLFARFVEPALRSRLRQRRHPPDPILILVGIAMVVAGLAASLGFSPAVGALFAGLVFSSDPRAVRLDAAFGPVHGLLAPFFFIAVGAGLDLDAAAESLGLALPLLLAAIAGKVVGSALPLWWSAGPRTALIVGVSMVPRAEIALFVVDQGRQRPDLGIPASVHGATVFVVAFTCLVTPAVLRRMLARRPPGLDR